jgi:hypothetical protein
MDPKQRQQEIALITDPETKRSAELAYMTDFFKYFDYTLPNQIYLPESHETRSKTSATSSSPSTKVMTPSLSRSSTNSPVLSPTSSPTSSVHYHNNNSATRKSDTAIYLPESDPTPSSAKINESKKFMQDEFLVDSPRQSCVISTSSLSEEQEPHLYRTAVSSPIEDAVNRGSGVEVGAKQYKVQEKLRIVPPVRGESLMLLPPPRLSSRGLSEDPLIMQFLT